MEIDFYNSQRYEVDIVREMIKGYSSQSVSSHWTSTVFTFIVDLAAVNAQTILGYSSGHHKSQSRKYFIKCVSMQLRLIISVRVQKLHLSSTTIFPNNNDTDEEEEVIESDPIVNLVPSKCVICIQKFRGMKDEDRRLKGN